MKITSVTLNHRSIRGKQILLRLDLNVPLASGKISNDFKLQMALPTIKSLLSLGSSIIIVTHLGEPKPGQKAIASYSVKPLAKWLEKKIKHSISVAKTDWPSINKQAKNLKKAEIMMLENIRCFKGETSNDPKLAQQLAALADVYVNDAFAVSHRKHASVSAIQKFLPSYAGLLLEKELKNLEQARTPKKPFVLVMGGAKLVTKLPLLKALEPQASAILVGGGIANTFLASQGYDVASSLYDTKGVAMARRLFSKKIILPVDVRIDGRKILDIGPETIKIFSAHLAQARTIVWNGPMGMFERKAFAKGTEAIARAIAKATKKKAFSVVGGGETIAAAGKNSFTWVSTGGGATLAYLSGEHLPGLKRIVTL